jgi:hypothetical protein
VTDLDAAADAYVWGYPLVVMHRTRALHCSRTGPGLLNHRDNLATPASRTVVAPNNDTLYSSGWFDLTAGDLVIDVPPMDRPDRNWSVMALDAYTYVTYASRRLHGTDGVTVRLTLDPDHEWSREATTTIPVGTPTVWVLVRVMVDGPDDIDTARKLQRGITITSAGEHRAQPTTPIGAPNAVHQAGAGFFDELAAAMAIDPPAAWHPRPSPEAAAVAAGEHSLTEEELAEAVVRGEGIITRYPFANDTTANGWGTRLRGSDFGDNIVDRAAAAKYVLAGHHPVENRSYVALADAHGESLDGSEARTLRFPPGGTPPCDAFWSLTVYGTDMFLVDNELDRWSIGDRTPGLRHDGDGGLTLTIGGARPADTSNWLPAPAGPYRLGLRVYEGRPEVVDATWFPPLLQRG